MPYSGPEELVEASEREGRKLRVAWVPGLQPPPVEQVRQVSAVVFTKDDRIVVVGDGKSWGLPGGHIEPGERLIDALLREIREEVCAEVRSSGNALSLGYLGSQRVEDPAEPAPYYQARYWAYVRLLPWEPRHEIRERRLVSPGELVEVLDWHTSGIAAAIVVAAGRAKAEFLNRAFIPPDPWDDRG